VIHQATVTVVYAVHGPDLRTFARWRCLLCDAQGPLRTYRATLLDVDTHLSLTHRITRGQCVRIVEQRERAT
jgi:hypothetical protein